MVFCLRRAFKAQLSWWLASRRPGLAEPQSKAPSVPPLLTLLPCTSRGSWATADAHKFRGVFSDLWTNVVFFFNFQGSSLIFLEPLILTETRFWLLMFTEHRSEGFFKQWCFIWKKKKIKKGNVKACITSVSNLVCPFLGPEPQNQTSGVPLLTERYPQVRVAPGALLGSQQGGRK